jgi:hypothetical protein
VAPGIAGSTLQVIEARRVLAAFDGIGGEVGAVLSMAFTIGTSLSLAFSAACAVAFAWVGWHLTRFELTGEFA